MDILNKLQYADVRALCWLTGSIRDPRIFALAKALSKSGDGYLHIGIPVLLLSLNVDDLAQLCMVLVLAVSIERAIYWVLKNSLKRRRPQDYQPNFRSLITPSDQFSFPSGHSSGAFLLATVLAVSYSGTALVLYLWATSVALSRVVLGVHFPGDTIAGAIIGSGIALGTASILGAF